MQEYRKQIWSKFIKAVKEFEMIKNGDRIAIGVSGGKDSLLLLTLFKELKKDRSFNFEIEPITLNPGFKESDLAELCRSVNTLEESGLRDAAVKEFDRFRQGTHILPGGDSIKSEFKTLDKMTKEEAASQFEEDLVKNKKKSDSIIVKEAEFLGGI